MKFLTNPLLELPEYKEILACVERGIPVVNISGLSDSQKVHAAYSICAHTGMRGVFVAFNEMQARRVYEDFSFFLPEEVVFFPAREIMLHDVEAKSYDTVFQRVKAMDAFIRGEYRFAVTSAEALNQKLVSRAIFEKAAIPITLGGRIDLEKISQALVVGGYERVSVVEGRGQFAIRGGILDVYPVDTDSAVRVELFDDEIDSIRRFDVLTQRSVDRLQEIRILPAREVLYPVENREEMIKRIQEDLSRQLENYRKGENKEISKQLKARIQYDVDRIKNDYYFPGMDRYIPYILGNACSILEYTKHAVVFIDEPSRVRQRTENLLLEHYETCKNFMEKGQMLPNGLNVYFDAEEITRRLEENRVVQMNALPTEVRNTQYQFSIPSKLMNSYQGHIELLMDDLSHWKSKKTRIVVLSGTRGRGERLVEALQSRGMEAAYSENTEADVQPGQIVVTHGSLNKGFEYPEIGLVIVSDREVFGQDKRIKKASRKAKGSKISVFTDLNTGDLVVHDSHGIGQYVGIQSLVVENVKKDYLKIRYQDDGFLYIPTNQLDLIQKFIGSEGKTPKLSKLGGTDWARTKKKVKESLKELADELIKLYAQRQANVGYAFNEDTVWQGQLEALFPYQETDDQLKCIDEIKKDMEMAKPMDRLLCGDVGYGKTEVAIRAIFKAVMDGKQVAYLVPTTILAQQHYVNFKERMKDFPVKVDVISRFRSAAEQKKILTDVKSGNVDVLIGTHRLLQKDIHFKDLGLLVVDEEQRFGVGHKEKLKNLKPNIDVLTLTATPIPRTLHMSLTGIRDISVIEEPPEERYPVQTYVMEYHPDVIKDAIYREVSRQGQVFYLYNRVRTIQAKTSELQLLVPEARIAYAHGQMDEKQLEDIMYSFIRGEYDILVCTTIIESGLDMPNVNTIIVEDADKMGLAQLYQLRGRVGRSNRLAYAYVTYKKDKVLSEIAEKRLQAIKEFTEFGSGFKIAMRDLEIRGAGNLLGPEQHGQMESVGYDMYCKLLDEAVRELKGEPLRGEEAEISIDIKVNAYIEDAYIKAEEQKIEMYKRIASIQEEQDGVDVMDELTDRYGDLPRPVHNLVQIALIKVLARDCGLAAIQEKNDAILLQYRKEKQVRLEVLGSLMDKYKRRLMFTASNTPYITFKLAGGSREDVLDNIKILLQDIKKLQSS